ncbi:MAG: hypothetical protein FVQ82_01165 [Planctomycetes bacterium]|nr:hypothetical protein [Planctomycetota bacterium]
MSEIVTYKSDSTVETEARRAMEPCLLARGLVLFGVSSLVIIAAIAVPIPESFLGLLDAGWILTVCLSAAILTLSIMAKNLSELSGFASFVISITLMRLGFAVASAKSIIIHQSAGSLIEKTGSLLMLENLSLYAVVIPVAILAGVVMIFMATNVVIKKTSKYTTDTLPFKYISAEADLNASVINESQAAEIKGKIQAEAKFYISMATTGKFLRFDAVINVLIVGCGALVILKSHAAKGVSGSVVGDGAVEVGIMLALGLWAVVFLPAIVLAFSSGSVVNKKNMHADSGIAVGAAGNDNNQTETVDSEENEFELLNPDFVDVSSQVGNGRRLDIADDFADNSDYNIESKNKDIANEVTEGEDMYADIAELIMAECQNGPVTALLCSESVELLPVTTAVKIAVELTDREKKCLLIDADTARDAVYKVFDIAPDSGAEPVDSCIENLSVWAVCNESKTIGNDLAAKINKVGGDYDCIIIYAPRIEDSNFYGKLAGFVSVAGFATGSNDNDEKYILQLKGLLASVDCKCIVRESLA